LLNCLPKRGLWNDEIDKYMKGNHQIIKYIGCFPKDKIPKMFYDENKNDFLKCVIANNEPSTKNGQHWLVLIKGIDGKTYIYDSFFRQSEDKDLGFPKKWIEPYKNPKIEQKILQTNCGSRCISFIKTLDKYGFENAFNFL